MKLNDVEPQCTHVHIIATPIKRSCCNLKFDRRGLPCTAAVKFEEETHVTANDPFHSFQGATHFE
jgi:hypothetical protein